MDYHKDYYRILGVSTNATREQIKSAYRKLVMKYHPDRNPNDAVAEEKMKAINEAYEILDSDINRFVYDEYKRNEEKIKKEEEAAAHANEKKGATKPNQKTYERTTKITKERRVYVKGTITVKYWAEQEDDVDLFIMKEMNYRLNPVSAEAIITHSDIHDIKVPRYFQKAYKEAEIFRTPLVNPVKCTIISENGNEQLYDLNLQDIRIIDPILYDIVKHEKQSLGTLKGEFYGCVLRIDEEEVIVTVTECFGETGKIEKKTEGDNDFYRKEYYYKDCTTYWGTWIKIVKARPAAKQTAKDPAKTFIIPTTSDGCLQYWWIPLLLLFLFVWPQLFLGLLAMGLIGLLFSFGAGLLGRLLPFLGLLLLAMFIYSAYKSSGSRSPIIKRDFKPSYDSLNSTTEPIVQDTLNASDSSSVRDTLINHFIRWKDYDTTTYAINLSVSANDVRHSVAEHSQFEFAGFYNSLAPFYSYLENTDQVKLARVYNAFDSIKKVNMLGNTAFAKMVVSCIQSIPYYLVVDQSCNADFSNDEFVYNYLEQCNTECCIGNIKYGVRSPVEFMSDLKGDCDTRALIIYSILKRFDYDVALLTSQYYKHALVAVNFGGDEVVNGLSMNINNKNFYLWETTSPGFQPGQVPEENRNLSYWEIALLNEKK